MGWLVVRLVVQVLDPLVGQVLALSVNVESQLAAAEPALNKAEATPPTTASVPERESAELSSREPGA